MIHLLGKLATAVTQAVDSEQIHATKQVATELSRIKTLPTWLPKTDFRFYLGLATTNSV